MAGAEVRRRLKWLLARVVDVIDENPTARTIVFHVPGWIGHVPGQHVDLRLTAADGYQAQRSYSISTPAESDSFAITVELVSDGEVSPFLTRELRVGDQIELRGPIGGYFVWESLASDPLFLIGGGSGVVPLMAMIRARSQSGSRIPVSYLASARSFDRLIYYDELTRIGHDDENASIVHTLTRSQPENWNGPARRVDAEMLATAGFSPAESPDIYVCGPTAFVETVLGLVVSAGHRSERIRAERFGPSGG